jgi:hypothetical protein
MHDDCRHQLTDRRKLGRRAALELIRQFHNRALVALSVIRAIVPENASVAVS